MTACGHAVVRYSVAVLTRYLVTLHLCIWCMLVVALRRRAP